MARHLVLDPLVHFVRPVIEGSRVFAEVVVEEVASGLTAEQVAETHGLSREAVLAAVSYAASEMRSELTHFDPWSSEHRRAQRAREAVELRSAISAALAIRSMLLSETAEHSLRACGDPDLLTACLVSVVKGASEDRVIRHLVGTRPGLKDAVRDAINDEARAAAKQAAACDDSTTDMAWHALGELTMPR